MEAGHPRHDISDRDWGLLAQHLPGRKCVGGGGIAKKTTDHSSMRCFRYCEQGLLGEICRLILETGAIRIGDLFDGEMPEFGRRC